MKKIAILILFLAALLGGIKIGLRTQGKPIEQKNGVGVEEHHKEFPLLERKSFAFIVYAHNQEDWCERSLRSIFEQEYDYYRVIFIDDGSNDKTFEAAKSYVLENHQEQRVILMQNETKLGSAACLFRAIENLLDKEIVFFLDAKDWLAHSGVLTRLNAVFQNPNLWMVQATAIGYPSFVFESKGIVLYYAALFKQLRIADLFENEKFTLDCKSYIKPLLELSGNRTRDLKDPLLMLNRTQNVRHEKFSPPLSRYSPLTEFPKSQLNKSACDIVLFSFDRPMQLYACLESIHRYMEGFENVFVLYRATDSRFVEAYETLRSTFPGVYFVKQSEKEPKRDFKPLLLKILAKSPSPYVLFGVDDIIVKDSVDLKNCMEMMEKTGAYGFYLRFGKHIQFCYQSGQPQPVPESVPLTQNIYAWNIKKGSGDWGYPNSLDMTLFRKKDLREPFRKMKYKTPNSLEFIWATEHAPEKAVGLYFEHSKIVNIPLNIVGKTGNPHMNFSSVDELLCKFNEGWKIDIEPLHAILNSSPHFEFEPKFIAR